MRRIAMKIAAWDEDEKAKRVGSLERDEPIFLPVETLGHR
jgi:hypothetical protein